MKEPIARTFIVHEQRHAAAAGPRDQTRAAADASFGSDGFGFDDLIDMINPLQHLPVVGTLYRAITGDEIAPAARLVGGGLFGGPLGLALTAADLVFEDLTGAPVGETVLTALTGSDPQTDPPPGATRMAGADLTLEPAAPPPVAASGPPRLLLGARDAAAAQPVPELSPQAMAILLQAVNGTPAPDGTPPPPDRREAAGPSAPASAADAYLAAMAQMERNLARYQAEARAR